MDIFGPHPKVVKVVEYKKTKSLSNRLRFIGELRLAKYDMVVDLKNSLVPYLAGARYKPGLLSGLSQIAKKESSQHKVFEHLSKLRAFGVKNLDDFNFYVPTTDKDRIFVQELLQDAKHMKKVVICPGAKSNIKRWNIEKYAELSDMLVSELGCKVYVSGNKDDKDIIDKFMTLAKESTENICGRTTIGALAELMKHSSLVITNDSAPLHIASAAGVPTIALFGATDEVKYGPLSKKSRILKPLMECRPCGKSLCFTGMDLGCILQIPVKEVFLAAKEILGGQADGKDNH